MTLYTPEISNEDILKDKKQRWRTFCLDNQIWDVSPKIINELFLSWEKIKFNEQNVSKVPEAQGIYMFVVETNLKTISNFGSHYIIYVGQTINLRDRFKTYFRYKSNTEPSDQLKRIMVLLWENNLYFNFTVTKLEPFQLTDLEFDLIDAIVPPMNLRFRARAIKENVKLYSPR